MGFLSLEIERSQMINQIPLIQAYIKGQNEHDLEATLSFPTGR
jgi:hypothetical protein